MLTVNINLSLIVSVVIVIPYPFSNVKISAVLSAAMFVCPSTAICWNVGTAGAEFETVATPVAPSVETVIPKPCCTSSTPVLVNCTAPVVVLTVTPSPGVRPVALDGMLVVFCADVTPVLVIVTLPVAELTEIPVLAIDCVTPALINVMLSASLPATS